MSYTKRTCNKCGIRKPQPEMVRKTEAAIAMSTNPKRKDSTRLYGRPKTVWYCQSCASAQATQNLIVVSIICAAIAYFVYFA